MKDQLPLHNLRVSKIAFLVIFFVCLNLQTAQGGQSVFTTAGSQSWTVPAGTTSIDVKAWGGGGGGGAGGDSSTGGDGGGGGFAQTTLTVTPGESLTIYVGGGGGGGSPRMYSGDGAGGGGYSGVLRGSTSLIIAAGAAGGGGGDNSSATAGGAGGPGGGTTGTAGSSSGSANGGGGGTQASGGSGGTGGGTSGAAGGSKTGGAGANGGSSAGTGNGPAGGTNDGGAGGRGDYSGTGWGAGAGGGSGYYGGGGGSCSASGNAGGGGGGGGSSYTTGTNASTSSGSGQSAGNTGDPDYAGNAGSGGNGGGISSSGSAGNTGRVVISYNCVFGYQKSITVQSSQVSGGPHNNFPLLVNIATDANLKTTANSGHVTSSNGYDIIFRALDDTTCGGAGTAPCTLDHEIEKYDGTSGHGDLVAWVRVPSINTGTVVYMYYGNDCITSSTENPTGVWDSNFKAVWHLEESSGGTHALQDSTSNANHGTDSGSPTLAATGKIGPCVTLDGSNDYIYTKTQQTNPQTFTVSVWFKTSTASGRKIVGFESDQTGTASSSNDRQIWMGSDGKVRDGVYPNPVKEVATSGTYNNGNWHYAVMTYGSGTLYLYLDGSSAGSIAASTAQVFNGWWRIGSYQTNGWTNGSDGYFTGSIDEVRVSNSVRSANWILTEYRNQSAPSTFYSVGSEQASPPTVVTLASFSARTDGTAVKLDWVTKTEIDNLGFNLFRSTNNGPYTQLNHVLIPGLLSSITGRAYTYEDTNVPSGVPVCYLLEDIDLAGTRTTHGPACVFLPSLARAEEAVVSGQWSVVNTSATTGSREQSAGSSGSPPDPGTPASGYPTPDRVSGTGLVTAVTLRSLAAHTDGTGVLITWTTGREVNNLGFHVYREEGGRRTRLTRELLAGAALKTGAAELSAGHTYSFVDTVHHAPFTVHYYVEDIDLAGTHTLHGPVTPTPTGEPLLRTRLPFLSELTGEKGAPDTALRVRLGVRRQGYAPGRPFPRDRMSPQATQRALAGSTAVKLFIRDEGWYRVPLTELTAVGITAGNVRFLQLFVEGKEEPFLVRDGAIEFYGRSIDSPYTDTLTYWLVNGARPGKRIQKITTQEHFSQTSFPYTVTLKERSIYFAALQNGDAENFFGAVITTEPVEKELTVTKRAHGQALLEVVLQGVTVQAHEVAVTLNGQALGTVSFSGQHQGKASFLIPSAGLREGTNSIRLTGGGELDVTMLDTLKLTYPRTYTAADDTLLCTARGGREVTLRGFTTNRVTVMDVTDPTTVQEVAGETRTDGAGYAVKIGIPGTGDRSLIAVAEHAALAPAALLSHEPSAWYRYEGADLIIVSHHDFMGSLTPLQSLREQEGLIVAVVAIEAIYDEFSFGMKSPYALKAFMTHARTWRRPPAYLLLVGDASIDPKNYLGLGSFDFVPTKLVDATYLETASDDWFVDAKNDLIPDIPVGRLPVRTQDEAALVVAKLTGYAETEQGRTALLIADQTTDEDLFDFKGASDELKAFIPEGITQETFSRGTMDDGELKAGLLAAFNQGPLFVNYVGHGSTEIWHGDIFDSSDAETLTNGSKLPFVVAMTCLNGLFQDLYTESLAEALLLAPKGGAIAVFASSGLTNPEPQALMDRALLPLLFRGDLTLGQAILQAKQATSDPDVRKTWILFGDPATRLR